MKTLEFEANDNCSKVLAYSMNNMCNLSWQIARPASLALPDDFHDHEIDIVCEIVDLSKLSFLGFGPFTCIKS